MCLTMQIHCLQINNTIEYVISIKDTIKYVIHKIYDEKILQPISKKKFFRRKLYKFTTECTFQFHFQFLKQIDGCSMDGPLSAILADIDMIRSKNEAVRRLNPSFYKRSVDDIYTKRNKNAADVLLKNLSSLHTNIVPTIKNLKKFLDTKVVLSTWNNQHFCLQKRNRISNAVHIETA